LISLFHEHINSSICNSFCSPSYCSFNESNSKLALVASDSDQIKIVHIKLS